MWSAEFSQASRLSFRNGPGLQDGAIGWVLDRAPEGLYG